MTDQPTVDNIEVKRDAVIKAARHVADVDCTMKTMARLRSSLAELDAAEAPDPWKILRDYGTPDDPMSLGEWERARDKALDWYDRQDNAKTPFELRGGMI